MTLLNDLKYTIIMLSIEFVNNWLVNIHLNKKIAYN